MTIRTTRITFLGILTLLAALVWSYPLLGGQAHAHNDHASNGFNRPNLQLCVALQGGGQVTGEVMSKVQTAFVRVKQHRDFAAAGLNRGDGPKIRAGCPSASTLKTEQWGRNTVATPGDIHTYVFLASEQDLAGVGFKHYPRVVGHEQQCHDTQCASVANAVYLTMAELNDPETLVTTLTAGIGLMTPDMQVPTYNSQVTPDDKTR